MSDNVPGSELSPRDDPYKLPPLRSPQSIDGEPHEALAEALGEYIEVLGELTGYAQRLEDLTRSVMMSEALTLPDALQAKDGSPDTYAQGTYELHAVAKANQALGIALNLAGQAAAELEKPIAESRRML
jgi:hypothetical protein